MLTGLSMPESVPFAATVPLTQAASARATRTLRVDETPPRLFLFATTDADARRAGVAALGRGAAIVEPWFAQRAGGPADR